MYTWTNWLLVCNLPGQFRYDLNILYLIVTKCAVAALCRHSPKPSPSMSNNPLEWVPYSHSNWLIQASFYLYWCWSLQENFFGEDVSLCVFEVLIAGGDLLIDPIDTKYRQEPSMYIVLHHQQGNLISRKIIHSIIILKYWSKLLAIHKRLN